LPSTFLRSLAAVLAALSAMAFAQAPAPKQEGDLDKFMNRDTKDVQQRLELLTHTLYAQQQQIITILFNQEHGERIKMRQVWIAARDKKLVPSWVFTPVKMDQGKRYPAIVMVHGGFHEHFDERWFKKVNTAISQGYVVIFPEYRGSRGYGAEIYKSDYGTLDTSDVLDASHYFAQQSYVDASRMAIFGQSRGGMVTLLAIEREPKLYRAAVDLVGLADFVAFMAYKPEWRRIETAKENASFKGKTPDENLPAYMAVSPVFHVDKIETPLFVVATTGDTIAPWELHSGRLIDALKARNKVHESKIYDNAAGGHTFTDGDTEESRDALKRIFEFIGKHLKP
jgi:dipeptidyl aminopeptidase/acylaminoacyl peptidase